MNVAGIMLVFGSLLLRERRGAKNWDEVDRQPKLSPAD
jgi:hypothetical protein